MAERTDVMISSTARDLPEHRKEVMDACLRQGMFPHMMEHLPANDAEAISASLKLVDEAEIYVGVFAHRYGYVPRANNPQQISITEMEYNRAVERKIPRAIFVMDKTHPLTIDDVEQGAGADKLKAFKERVQTENIVNFFNSPADLRAHVINSLSKLRQPDLTTFHYVSDIPQPPEPFIAHPYTLLQTHRLVGRQPELNLLTDWVARPDADIYRARILNIVAVGGLGKSALTWHWFNAITPQEMRPLAGRMWWSFYESDATFNNFVTRALAYVTRRPLPKVQRLPAPDRETQLLAALDREPFLLVLDGLERILIAYARMDAAHLADDDYDRQTANFVANAYGLPASAAQSFTGEHRLRKTADPRAGSFLRKLASARASRILVSARLYPADLQTVTSEPLPGCFAIFLRGLADDDALDLWRAFGATGARDSLLPLFQRADNHPLLIQALASEVARYRRAPGDFGAWRRSHPDFDPFSLPLINVKSHILEFAMRGLDYQAYQVLCTIAAFRMPARYDTLASLLVGKSWLPTLFKHKTKPCTNERELDQVLTELEDRGLVGWDKRANRYDLHPIVRGVVWSSLSKYVRRGVYKSLYAHFEALIKGKPDEISNPDDLSPAIELYNTLIGLGRNHDAAMLFSERLSVPMLDRFANHQRIELLEMLFPNGLDQLPRLSAPYAQAYALVELGTGYLRNGQPERAALLYRRANSICQEMKATLVYQRNPSSGLTIDHNLSIGLFNLSHALLSSGFLRESETTVRRALTIMRKQGNHQGVALYLCRFGLNLAARGLADESESILWRAARLFAGPLHYEEESYVKSHLAQRALWLGNFTNAQLFADTAWEMSFGENKEAMLISAARQQGEAALGLNDFATTEERLQHTLTRARIVNYVEEELPALVALAELRRRQGEAQAARELLDDVWEAAERGPYPLIHADACNLLARIERDAGQQAQAIAAATEAYRLAWCDGPPFAYHWGLEKARGLLRELGASEPEMPAFDETKFEPMPEVEIDPADEFGAQAG